jgi:hypothetical protein
MIKPHRLINLQYNTAATFDNCQIITHAYSDSNYGQSSEHDFATPLMGAYRRTTEGKEEEEEEEEEEEDNKKSSKVRVY